MLVQFIFLFAAVYLAAVFYNLIRTMNDFREVMMVLAGERYFVLLRSCTFFLLVSSVEFVSARIPVSRMRFLLCLCLLLSFALVRHYHTSFQ